MEPLYVVGFFCGFVFVCSSIHSFFFNERSCFQSSTNTWELIYATFLVIGEGGRDWRFNFGMETHLFYCWTNFITCYFVQECYLVYILTEMSGSTSMVFTRTCDATRLLSLILRNLGLRAIPISGQMTQVLLWDNSAVYNWKCGCIHH